MKYWKTTNDELITFEGELMSINRLSEIVADRLIKMVYASFENTKLKIEKNCEK